MARVLIVEDERVLAKNIRDKLTAHGHEAQVVANGAEALLQNARLMPDIVLLDVRLPDVDGLTLLPKLRADDPSTQVVVMTAHGNERIAVEAMKGGAFEYLTKPVDLDELQLVVARAAEAQQVSENLAFLRNREGESSGVEQLVGESEAIRHVKEFIRRLTRTDVLSLTDAPTVLITGETGTGKDLVARAMHYDGPRRRKPFIHVNCTALPASLFESELFGHLRGAFTNATQAKRGLFEVAQGGTIFLDEIGHIDPEMQAKLLLAIERREIRPVGATDTRPINAHVIAATNRDLHAAVEAGEFRADLYHRLRVLEVHLPPLRARRDDIPVLASHFLGVHARRFGMPPRKLAAAAIERCQNHAWRGNVRELSHVIESALLQVDGAVIEAGDLRLAGETASEAGGDVCLILPRGRTISIDFEKGEPRLDEIEYIILQAAYEYTGRNLSRAARTLGITREALRYRLGKMAEASAAAM